jgi:hypothetical protein
MTLSTSVSSRNDLFSTSLAQIPPPRPPPPLSQSISSSRTSSFFDVASPPTPSRQLPLGRPSPLNLVPGSRHSSGTAEPLSPLHQSPSLPSVASSSWQPPIPPRSDDVSLRFLPDPTYHLGEGRYATVYLASYKQQSAGWQLCAAKRMSPDRDSQTMGLREAFFLNRLTGSKSSPERGSLYIVKLIAVKEDESRRGASHSRSASDAVGRSSVRQRSSTLIQDEPSLSSHPSLPALNQGRAPAPSFSRLILLLEHAPLGTLDRLLRSSPGLVGREMWCRWARESTEALAWVHSKGVVHADVKPGNLLVGFMRNTADASLQTICIFG